MVKPRDILMSAALAAVTITALFLMPFAAGTHREPDNLAVALVLLMTGVLCARHRWPVTVLVINVLAVVGYQLMDYPAEPALPGVLIALYTVASVGERRRSLIVGLFTCVLVVATLAVTEPATYGVEMLGALGWVIVALALGEAVRYHRAYSGEVDARVARAEVTRDEEARRRIADERIRIARDVHDVLAHSIAAINVQAGVAAHLIDETPHPDGRTLAAVADLLRSIADTSRDGVNNLRATLDLLRGEEPARSDPLPGVHGIMELADSLRATGMAVDVDITGAVRPIPAAHDVAVYRIVQEAMTNAVKHGRPGLIQVSIVYEPTALRVTVTDDGALKTTRPTQHGQASSAQSANGSGYGILGMHERAHSVGGRLTAGRRSAARGFMVSAVLPLPQPAGEADIGFDADVAEVLREVG